MIHYPALKKKKSMARSFTGKWKRKENAFTKIFFLIFSTQYLIIINLLKKYETCFSIWQVSDGRTFQSSNNQEHYICSLAAVLNIVGG